MSFTVAKIHAAYGFVFGFFHGRWPLLDGTGTAAGLSIAAEISLTHGRIQRFSCEDADGNLQIMELRQCFNFIILK